MKLLKAGFTGTVDHAPDKDWTVPFTVQQEAPGVWRLTPTASLAAGEYRLWDLEGMALAPFGVDTSKGQRFCGGLMLLGVQYSA